MTADRAATDPRGRYCVGIDLGTTNSAVAYVDAHEASWTVRTFCVPQVVAPGEVEARETLPSFHYEAAADEFAPAALNLPWDSRGASRGYAVGFFARDHGADSPARSIASAKSWLCHAGVDRTAELLPWHGADDVPRHSPVEVSSRYLRQIREAWDDRFAPHVLAEQDVVLTLPASFDEVARELTVKAARQAGLPRVVLIEEPQAAFYAWIYSQGDAWEARVRPGQKILVCDIGGGTSDFTLIRVRKGEDGRARFHRVAVGEHLILGGDNVDLALAHRVEGRLAGDGKLDSRSWAILVRACRRVKETLLGETPPASLQVSLPQAGPKVIGGALRAEVTREEMQALAVEGFLPACKLEDKPVARRSGFREFGLPYAADAAMTRYLAAFLAAHRHVALDDVANGGGDPARPDLVLFNGGFFASPLLRQRLLDVLSSWFGPPAGPTWRPEELHNARLDLAVAHGAAYYGMVRRGLGVRIAAGLARTYYVGVDAGETAQQAICLLPAGIEEGGEVDLRARKFWLRIRQPVEFPLFASSTRLTDPAGALIPIDPEQMAALPPIRTVVQATRKGEGDEVTVHLHARLTEIGTMELWCAEAGANRQWKLEFDVRAATQTDMTGHAGAAERQGFVDQQLVEACRGVLRDAFGAGEPRIRPESVVKRLEEASGQPRRDWPSSLLRGMWETSMECEAGRRRGAAVEARWLYLAGYCLRPGYGLALDDWRVAQTWKLLQGKRLHHTPACRVEWLILWRRLAGGLSAGQQRALAEPILADLRPQPAGRGKQKRGELQMPSHELAEAWRLLASLEWLPISARLDLGRTLVDRLRREKVGGLRDAALWSLGRLGARAPLYGPLNTVPPANEVARWVEQIVESLGPDDGSLFPLVQLGRKTGDRQRDLPENVRRTLIACLQDRQAPARYIELVEAGGQLAEDERGLAFGESLPAGLRVTEAMAT